MVKSVSDPAEFDNLIKVNAKVVVDVGATWCGPCRQMAPIFSKMSEEFKDIVFVKVDADQADELCDQLTVTSLPTFLFYKDGQKYEEFKGANETLLQEKVEFLNRS